MDGKDEQPMTKKVFAIITVLFIFAVFLGLVVLNSFFQENTALLNDRNKVDKINKQLTKDNLLLRQRVPSLPNGAVIEGMRVSPDPANQPDGPAKYILTLWVKNPTKRDISAINGMIYIQGIGAGARPEILALNTPFIAPGERRLFTSQPLALGAPGGKIEIVASLWQEPGVAKLVFAIPEVKLPAPVVDPKSEPKPTKEGQTPKSDETTETP